MAAFLIFPIETNIWEGFLHTHGLQFFGVFLFFCFFNFYLFIYLWLCWVFVSVRGLSLVAASGDHSSSRCAGLSLSRPLLLRGTGSRRAGSVIVAHGPSRYAACGIFPDQGSNPCPPHWQADSQPLRHQGNPGLQFLSQETACYLFNHLKISGFFSFFSARKKIPKARPFLPCLPLYPHYLTQCLAHVRCSINICWLNNFHYKAKVFQCVCFSE